MKTTPHSTKKLLVDLIPPLTFYIVYVMHNLVVATAALMAASVLVVALNKLVFKKGSRLVYISTAFLGIFGGLTILSGDSTYIKMKPTFVYTIFSAIMLVDLKRKSSMISEWVSATFSLEIRSTRKIIKYFAIFWLFLAILNEVIWRNFDETTWVLLKSFGFTILNTAFCFYCYIRFILPQSR